MKVKTVSRLPEVTNINNEDLFQLSRKINGYDDKYNSVKIKYETILSSAYDTIDEKISEKYNLEKNTIEDIEESLAEKEDQIDELSNSVYEIEEKVENLEDVTPEWDIRNMDSYIIPSTRGTKGSFMVFKFSNPSNTQVTNSETMSKTGNLFCYGWITAPKVLDPADAWVVIEAEMTNNNWAMIALQPWIIGDKSSVMQYIGFNCPVQKDMKIRIRTGFQITDFRQSFSGRGLVLDVGSDAQGSNINNSFIGYILGGEGNI